jgi:BirA family biotin operon repressor/biotin-[acetyl-CoA-carboxylase] ligase
LNPKPLDKGCILGGLKTRWVGRSLLILDDCTSTNDVIERIAEGGASHGAVVIAETQHAGRGRFGRPWYSPRGGIWLSILIRPQGSLSLVGSLPLIGALAIAKVLLQNWQAKAGVRWPNDVVVGGQKIAGILVESKSKGNELIYAALGLGINANVDMRIVEPIRHSSTSLLALLRGPINREKLIAGVLSEVEAMYELICAKGESTVVGILRDLDWSRGRRVRVRTAAREFVGVFDDYESLATARLSTRSGPEHVEANTVVSVDYESD